MAFFFVKPKTMLQHVDLVRKKILEAVKAIEKLKGFSYGAQTELLVGLPGETYQSFVNELESSSPLPDLI